MAYHLCTSVAHGNTDCGSGELNREDEAPGLLLDFLGVETLLSFSFSFFLFFFGTLLSSKPLWDACISGFQIFSGAI